MPASSAVLAKRPYQDVAFVLFLEGWRIAFTNRRELAGEGSGSWIGTADGNRKVVTGLEQPDSIRHSISIEAGLPADNDVTFSILDAFELLIPLFAAGDADGTGQRLAPTDDPAPANIISDTGGAVALHGRYINGESIGPDGERRQYQVMPSSAGGSMPGYDHAATLADEQYLCPSEVVDVPRWFEGRRMSLYLIRRDPDTGEWVTWEDAETSGYGRLWWGTARRATVSGREWQISCDGPGSWLRASLNRLRPSAWRPVLVDALAITEAQGYCAVAFRKIGITHTGIKECGNSFFDGADQVATAGDSPIQVRQALGARLAVLANASGPDEEFTGGAIKGSIDVGADNAEDERTIFKIQVGQNDSVGGELWLALHERVWRWLGFDPQEQNEELANVDSEFELPFRALPESNFWTPGEPLWSGGVGAEPPTAGYYAARITTCAIGATFNDLGCDNEGEARHHRAQNPEGVMLLQEGSTLTIALAGDAPYVGPQLARPVDDAEVDGAPCDQTGFIALRGSFKAGPDAEPETITSIWKASWYSVANGGFGGNAVHLSKQLDPRLFGINNGKVPTSKDWAVVDLEWASVAVFGRSLTSYDLAHAVLLRLILSTGTSTWTGYEGDPDADQAPGQNAHPGAPLDLLGNDFEVADLSLGVPAQMVDWPSFYASAAKLPGGLYSEINRCRIGRIGPVDGGDLVKAILHPRGWAIGLQGGKFTLWSKSRPIDIEDSVASLTQSDLDSTDIPYIEAVDLSPLQAFDKLTCAYGQDPIGGGSGTELVGQPRDAGSWRRNGGAEMAVDGSTLLPNPAGADTPSWRGDFTKIWGTDLAKFFASPHVIIEVPVRADKAADIWPGCIVRFGSPWPASRGGVYGISGAIARVLATTQDLRTNMTKKVRMLVQAGDPKTGRRFAPIAVVLDDVTTVEQRHDADARTFFCYDDAFVHGGASRDVAGFEEPEWLAVGGDAKCIGWQHDGRGWSQTFGFTLESVNVVGGSLTHKPGSFTGKFWERRWTFIVLAPYDDQDTDSWTRALFGVICRPSGVFGASDTKGWKFT